MMTEANIETVKEVLREYLKEKGFRNTPERYTILEEVYRLEDHFTVDDLYFLMVSKKYHISKATIYNTMEVFLDIGLVRRHQFGEKNSGSSYFEKSYFNNQHDHLIIYSDDEKKEIAEILEFCDPRIENIKKNNRRNFQCYYRKSPIIFLWKKKQENAF